MPISCHFRDCKALLVTSLTRVSGAIASVQTFLHKISIDILLQMEDINEVLQTRRLTYFEHVTSTEKDRYPNILMHGYTDGRQPRWRPRKRWLDNITDDCEDLNLTIHQASCLANDRVKW